MNTTLKRVCAYTTWTLVLASLLHGAVHVIIGGPLTPLPPSLFWLGIGADVVSSFGSLVALALLYTRWMRTGAVLFLLTMVASLLWGFGAHFLFASGDNIMAHAAEPGGPAFLLTSIIIFIVPWVGITAAIPACIQVFRQPTSSL